MCIIQILPGPRLSFVGYFCDTRSERLRETIDKITKTDVVKLSRFGLYTVRLQNSSAYIMQNLRYINLHNK